jgi:uncharacterized LabA/DUF88 family protein
MTPPLNYGRVGIFIDGENIKNTLGDAGWKISYQRLLEWIAQKTKCSITKPFFYTKEEKISTGAKKTFVEHIRALEMHIISIPITQKIINETLTNICDADPQIITDMMDWKNEFDKVVLISGDGAFEAPLERLWQHGKKVYVISTNNYVSNQRLRNNPNFTFTDLNDIRNLTELIL